MSVPSALGVFMVNNEQFVRIARTLRPPIASVPDDSNVVWWGEGVGCIAVSLPTPSDLVCIEEDGERMSGTDQRYMQAITWLGPLGTTVRYDRLNSNEGYISVQGSPRAGEVAKRFADEVGASAPTP